MAFIARGFFTQLLARDIENHKQTLARDTEVYKANLQAELEFSKLRLQNTLQTEFFRYQTKFSLFHAKQAEIIGETYSLLVGALQSITSLVNPLQMSGDKPKEEKFKEAAEKFNKLSDFFSKHRIYFDEDICTRMDELLSKMHKAFLNYSFGQQGPAYTSEKSPPLREAWNAVKDEIPVIEKALQRQFRRILSDESIGIIEQSSEKSDT